MGNVTLALILVGWFVLLVTPLLWFHLLSQKKTSLKTRYSFVRRVLKVVSWGLRCKYHVEGLENVPKTGPVMIVPNHQSAFDPLILISIMKEPMCFLSKIELQKTLYVGDIIRLMDGYFLDRKDYKGSLKIFKSMEKRLKEIPNYRILLFAEGTRTKLKDFHLNDYKPGAFRSAYPSKTTIVPVYIQGSFRILGNLFNIFKLNHTYIKFGTPLLYEDYKDLSTPELAEKLKTTAEIEVEKLKEISPIEKYYAQRSIKTEEKLLEKENRERLNKKQNS
ncbi:MAG: 1-acyl-sn-glycerol-3-phosphate acyltransferase [Bacillales bacterium]|jgi:1-acyl-sn-glycerol-3-phosphate acyltransferase|nr:1-acyl-sn-glycerol-3-phosphate acyltransferase [Bacillales bacterium]